MLSDQPVESAYNLYPLGDQAIVVEFGHVIHETVHANVLSFAATLEKYPFQGLIEYVPAFTTFTIYYDAWLLSHEGKKDAYAEVSNLIHQLYTTQETAVNLQARTVNIPVCYGGEFGPDLLFVASYTGLTPEEAVALHAAGEYKVYMIGFAPGFPYLGGLNPRLAVPRKEIPCTTIPAGSVGIGGKQTGIYPISTPGGWQLIGRTPLHLFDPSREHPSLLKAGDIVRFIPITAEEYLQVRKEADIEH